MSRLRITEDAAIRARGLPSNFKFFRFAWMPPASKQCLYMEMEGCVPDKLFRSGPRKGKINYLKCSGRQTVYVTPAEMDSWVAEWESKTGKCSECNGGGFVSYAYFQDIGGIWSKCRKCKGSCKPKAANDPHP